MDFKFVPEPYVSEINNYIRQRREHLTLFGCTADARAELLRPVAPGLCAADTLPRGRTCAGDDEYVEILRDMLNLSAVLDDMELTGVVPYQNRSTYYNVYGRLYRLLTARAKAEQQSRAVDA
jgi:hypothetical protein